METLDTRRGRDDAFRLLLQCRGLRFKIISSSGQKTVSLLDRNSVQVAMWDVTVRKNELYVYRRKCNPSKLTNQQCDALVAFRLTQLQSTGCKAIRFAHNGQCTGKRCFRSIVRAFENDLGKCSSNTSQEEEPYYSEEVIYDIDPSIVLSNSRVPRTIRGPTGPPGVAGAAGQAGQQGAAGQAGQQGAAGQAGQQGNLGGGLGEVQNNTFVMVMPSEEGGARVEKDINFNGKIDVNTMTPAFVNMFSDFAKQLSSFTTKIRDKKPARLPPPSQGSENVIPPPGDMK